MSQKSRIRMEKEPSIREHCVASLTCLLSCINVFNPDYPQDKRYHSTIKGLYDLLPYSYQHWWDDVLLLEALPQSLRAPPELGSVMMQLSSALEKLHTAGRSTYTAQDPVQKVAIPVNIIESYPGLCAAGRMLMEERTRKAIPDEISRRGMSARGCERRKRISIG